MDGLINNSITKLDIHKDWHYNVKMMNYTQDNINSSSHPHALTKNLHLDRNCKKWLFRLSHTDYKLCGQGHPRFYSYMHLSSVLENEIKRFIMPP